MKKRPIIDDEEEMYIPDIGAVDENIEYHESPRSNAGIALNWSPLEQQMFDLLFLNRVGTYERDVLTEMARTVEKLVDTFKPHEVARISAVAMLAFQLKATEGKNFWDEVKSYHEYVKNHPEDIEEV
ncbi:MAG: hypothetical protein IKZ58_09990 [Selenomonadaceae bacterium]|nr:hypothetical protein [Selenomonadaceae bacterium]